MANVFWKGPDSKHLGFVDHTVCFNYSTRPLQHESSLRRYINNGQGSDPVSLYLQKQAGGQFGPQATVCQALA